MAKPWDEYLTEQDREIIDAGGWGGSIGLPKRPAVLIIDVTYGFCGVSEEDVGVASTRFPTSCGRAAWAAVPKIKTLIETARVRELPLIYTTGKFRPDGWDYGAWRWKQVRNRGTNETAETQGVDPDEILSEIAPLENDLIVHKLKPSAFFGTNLVGYLNLLGCDGVIIAGCSSSGCVRATAVDAASHNYRTTVVYDACFDRFAISHAVAMFDLHVKYADVRDTDDLLSEISHYPTGMFPNRPTG